ncbi:phage protein [Bacillus cereus HuB4-4]|uniref:Phage protein n=1 Tax=Bacillus cereus HuB4-4 TaxID=1053211 RepID=A0A9W5QPI6_BACCE|nr:phage protein [Bacillus cereus HuB4-4]
MSQPLFEWFKDYKKLEDEIIYLENKLHRSKRELMRWSVGDLSKYKLTAESDGAKLEEHIAAIEYELANKMNDQYDLKILISKFEGLENKILFGKYVQRKTLESIARELGYSSSYVYQKHAEISRRIKLAEELTLFLQ